MGSISISCASDVTAGVYAKGDTYIYFLFFSCVCLGGDGRVSRCTSTAMTRLRS